MKVNLTEKLETVIKSKNIREIQAEKLKKMFSQIPLFDLFLPLKFECENIFKTEIKFDFNNNKTMTIYNAKNQTVKYIIDKINGFFQWFTMCQNFVAEDKKEKPRQYLGNGKNSLSEEKVNQMRRRINMIVDGSISYNVVKSWAQNSKKFIQAPGVEFHPRTMRMVTVCWILVNKFNCEIKGGFIRDWVVRGDSKIPNGLNLKKLLSVNPLNGHM